jgi:hypothetical protein
MTIRDRDVINQLDSYLNPDPVELIDGYLEKNFQVEPIMTEGGTAQAPESFFKEFDILTKGDMRSTLFDESFLLEEMDLSKASMKEIGGRLGGRVARTVRGSQKEGLKGLQRIREAARSVGGAAKTTGEATDKGWGTVKDNAWFAPWSASWRNKVGDSVKEGASSVKQGAKDFKEGFQEQRRLEMKANKPIKSRMYESNPKAYQEARGRLATRYAQAHDTAKKSLGASQHTYAAGGAEKLSAELGIDPATGEELHTLKEKDTRTKTTTAKQAASKKLEVVNELDGGRVEVAANPDTYGKLTWNEKGQRRNELLEKHGNHVSKKKDAESLSNEERNELQEINDGMNLRESAESIGTDLDMVEYHVNQIERSQHSSFRATDPRLNKVIPPADGWPDSMGGSEASAGVSSRWEQNGAPELDEAMGVLEEALENKGGVPGFEDAMLNAHVDHMQGQEHSRTGSMSEGQLASEVRSNRGPQGMDAKAATQAGGIPKGDREYIKPGQSAPSWGGSQVQEITTPGGARYYSRKQSAQLRSQAQEKRDVGAKQQKEEEAKTEKAQTSKESGSRRKKAERQRKIEDTKEAVGSAVEGAKKGAAKIGKKVAESPVMSGSSSDRDIDEKRVEEASKRKQKEIKSQQESQQKKEQKERKELEADIRAVLSDNETEEIKRRAKEAADAEGVDESTQEALTWIDRALGGTAEEKKNKPVKPASLDDGKIGALLGRIGQALKVDMEGEYTKRKVREALEAEGSVTKSLDQFFTLKKSKDSVDTTDELMFFLDSIANAVEYGLTLKESTNFATDMVSKSNDELDDYLDRVSISGSVFVKANLDSYKIDPVDEVQGMIDALILLDSVNSLETK